MWPKNTILNIDVFIIRETARQTCRGNKSKKCGVFLPRVFPCHYDITFSELGALENRSCAQVFSQLIFSIQHWRMSFIPGARAQSKTLWEMLSLVCVFPSHLISLNRIKSKIAKKYARAFECDLFYPFCEAKLLEFTFLMSLHVTHKAQTKQLIRYRK